MGDRAVAVSPLTSIDGTTADTGYLIIDEFGIAWDISAAAASLLRTKGPALPVYAFGDRPCLGLDEALHEHIRDAFMSEGQTTEIVVLPTAKDRAEGIRLDSRFWKHPADGGRHLITVVSRLDGRWARETQEEAEHRVNTFLSRVAQVPAACAPRVLVEQALQRCGRHAAGKSATQARDSDAKAWQPANLGETET